MQYSRRGIPATNMANLPSRSFTSFREARSAISDSLRPISNHFSLQLCKQFGLEAERHLLRCLFSSIDFSDAHSAKASLQAKLLSSELSSLLNKSSFVSSLCFALENLLPQQKVSEPRKFPWNCFKQFFSISDTPTNAQPHQSHLESVELLADPGDFSGARVQKFIELGTFEGRRVSSQNLLTSAYSILHRLR